MNERISNLIDEKIMKSHSAISKSISDWGSEVKKISEQVMSVKDDAIQHTGEHKLINMKLDEMNSKLNTFITKDQFWPVKTLVYSAVGIILTAVVIAGIGVIIVDSRSSVQAQEITK